MVAAFSFLYAYMWCKSDSPIHKNTQDHSKMSASNDYCSIQAKLCFHRLLLAPCCRILPNGLHHCHQWVTSRSTFKNNIMVIIKTTINNHFTIILVFVLVSRSHQPKHLAGDHGGPLALGDFSSNLPPTPHPCRILLLLVCISNQNIYNIIHHQTWADCLKGPA